MKSSTKKQRVSPCESCIYEFELIEGENLKGVISSSSHIDIYFVDNTNFSAWLIGKTFDHECCHESVFSAEITFPVQKEGSWYLLIENNGNKPATIEVIIDVSS